MATAFHGAMNTKRKPGRKNEGRTLQNRSSIDAHARYEKRKDAKAQRRKEPIV